MKRNKKRKRTRRGNQALGSIASAPAASGMEAHIATAKEGGLLIITAIASGFVGAALGRSSLIVGIPVTVYGVAKRSPYVVAAGLGLAVANGFQLAGRGVAGVDGLDFKQMTQDAKDRVKTFFENFKDKLYLSHTPAAATQTQEATNGIGDTNEEQVTYFVNPYGNQSNDVAALPELDMSAIDRIQEQIAEMNRPGAADTTAGLNEVEREF